MLLIQAAIHYDVIATSEELSTLADGLREQDSYRFSEADRNSLFKTVNKDG